MSQAFSVCKQVVIGIIEVDWSIHRQKKELQRHKKNIWSRGAPEMDNIYDFIYL